MQALLEITGKHNLLVLSDDIHLRLGLPGTVSRLLAGLATPAERIITADERQVRLQYPRHGNCRRYSDSRPRSAGDEAVFEGPAYGAGQPFQIVAFETA